MKKTRKSVESRIMRVVLCVFCAICIIFSGCSGGTDDDTTSSDDSTTTSGDNNGGTTGGEGEGKDPVVETSIFDLHCFTEGVKTFSVGGGYEGAAEFQYTYTKAAQKYIRDKFTDLQTQMQTENPAENEFKTVLNDALNLTDQNDTAYNLAILLDRGIPAFYQETAKYIAQIINNLGGNDQAKFRACYDHLAVQAYENSLTLDRNGDTYNHHIPVKGDKEKIAGELKDNDIKDQDVEKTLKELLDQVADNNNIKRDTLKDSVNLALDIDGLYGLHDSVYIQGGGTSLGFQKL